MSLQMESKDYIKNIDGAERRYFASEVRAVVVDGEAVRAVDGYASQFNLLLLGVLSFIEEIARV
jgi:hypothetical protein